MRSLAVLFCAAMLVASCADDDDGAVSPAPSAGSTASGGATGELERGGTLVLGAEQWPSCLNPITECALPGWTHWAVIQHVLPRLMDFDADSNFVPSPVLAGEPVLDGRGTGRNEDVPFTVTYRIRPEAVWDDGSPITADDIEFSWQAKMNTTGAVSRVGYDKIERVDKADEGKTATVVFAEPFADWADLFGGISDYVLKKAAFSGPDISNDLLDDIPFSGTGFLLESFSPDEARLVRNENFWDESHTPLVDEVVVRPMQDTDTEMTNLLAGQVHAIFPDPQTGVQEKLDDPDIALDFGFSVGFEGIWFNQASRKDPDSVLQDKAVREALLFAIDREAIIDQVIANAYDGVEVLNCAGWVPTIGEWCNEDDYADVRYDPARVDTILTGDGWAKDEEGIYAKGDRKLAFTWQTVAGNSRRELIQDLVIPQLRDLGFDVTEDNSDGTRLFQVLLPNMETEMALYRLNASPDPTVTTFLACESIPTPENSFAGQNVIGWCNRDATDLMRRSDALIAPEERLPLIHQIGALERQDAAWLPLYQYPTLTAHRTDKLAGPVGDFTSTPTGGFENIYDWSVK
ncbi:MAG: peptide ABC transporter substrate-binding protein [Acidimicrobiia bacterium]